MRRLHPYRILIAVAATLCGLAIVLGLLDGDGDDGAGAVTTRTAPEQRGLPGGAKTILPEHRVVAYYGAPGDDNLGILGIGNPNAVGLKLNRQARRYVTPTKPVMPAMELIAVVSTSSPGDDGKHRLRQADAVIRRYLTAARRANAILILDIQPGRASFLDEAKRLRRWLEEPDVSLALDPEWHVKDNEVPGQVIGSVTAGEINAVSAWLSDLVREKGLPEKLLIIHQFTDDMIQDRRAVHTRPNLDMVLNADGFGTPELKRGTYSRITKGRGHFFIGFKLFFVEDTGLMSPRDVLALRPVPLVVVYE